MVKEQVSTVDNLSQQSTEQLKQHLIELAQPRDGDSLSQKNKFYQTTLSPICEELAKRNPNPKPEDQAPLVLGYWKPIWSSIPFQDVLPGRRRDQSYQIFREDGYYANIARYAPATDWPILRRFSVNPVVYDLMLIQKYKIEQGEWQIENVGIKQALNLGAWELTLEKADHWFKQVMASSGETTDAKDMKVKLPFSKKANQQASKQLKGAAQAKPILEHLYIDENFRLVKSKRESKQRPSYTIAIRAT